MTTVESLVDSTQVEMFKELYNNFSNGIKDIDETLDSAQGGRSATKRTILNGLVDSNKDNIELAISEFVKELDKLPDESQQVAIFHGVVKGLKSKYDPMVESVLENLVKDVPETPPVPEDEIKRLEEMRKQLWNQVKAAREFLNMVGVSPEDYPMPKTRRGGRGPRGARAISLYTWTLDGVKLTGEDDSLLAISKKLGFAKKSELTKIMKESPGTNEDGTEIPGLDLTNPNDPLDFVLSADKSPDQNEHSIHGVKKIMDSEANPDDEDEDEDENNEE